MVRRKLPRVQGIIATLMNVVWILYKDIHTTQIVLLYTAVAYYNEFFHHGHRYMMGKVIVGLAALVYSWKWGNLLQKCAFWSGWKARRACGRLSKDEKRNEKVMKIVASIQNSMIGCEVAKVALDMGESVNFLFVALVYTAYTLVLWELQRYVGKLAYEQQCEW